MPLWAMIRRAIFSICSGVFPFPKMTSGKQRRKALWWSTFANPRSLYGRSVRSFKTFWMVARPARKSFSTRWIRSLILIPLDPEDQIEQKSDDEKREDVKIVEVEEVPHPLEG